MHRSEPATLMKKKSKKRDYNRLIFYFAQIVNKPR